MSRRSLCIVALAAILMPGILPAQARGAGKSGPRALLPRDREIALARSAGPPSVTAGARVYVLTAAGYVVADSGTTGAACYVSRSWPESLEPHCFDAEGAETILLMEMRRVELLAKGVSMEQVEREIADGVIGGRFRLPARPATSYMMSCAQRLISDEGQAVGKWRSHLMIYFPYLTNESIGLATGPDLRAAVVVNPGTPEANIMIPVQEFVTPESPAVCSP
jgi:hypothetical protein